MGILDTQLHFPDQLGSGDIVVIEGEIPCAICGQPLDQGSVDRGELFFRTNPATGETERQLNDHLHMLALAKVYAKGEGLKEAEGLVM